VELTDDATTLADIGADLLARLGARQVGAMVVCRSGLGTLNHTALTVEALHRRAVPITGLIIGSWPDQPDDVDISNREHLARHGVPLLGAVPEGAGRLPAARFRRDASRWFPGWP
jgi:dethiobiotin synthetase